MYCRSVLAVLLTLAPVFAQKTPAKAKNVIIFLADAGGIPTINAASIHGYGEPQKLFVQSWPNVALSDTSPAGAWVTDSAAGMSAIVTGVKTRNGVISEGPETIRGDQDGKALKTVLEYAEEHGLSSGVVSNVSIADATPAACYGHANDRRKQGELFLQIFSPRFGDGVDVVIGAGRKKIYDDIASLGKNLDEIAAAHDRPIYESIDSAPPSNPRPIVLMDKDVSVPDAARTAIRALSKNPKGYFLMVEWDAHTDDPKRGLDNIVGLDKLVREIASTVDLKNTLLLFTADHSFEFRAVGGKRGESILKGYDEWKSNGHTSKDPIVLPALHVGHSHTGEEVLATAIGAGATAVRGFLPNTKLFHVMLDAYGWKEDSQLATDKVNRAENTRVVRPRDGL